MMIDQRTQLRRALMLLHGKLMTEVEKRVFAGGLPIGYELTLRLDCARSSVVWTIEDSNGNKSVHADPLVAAMEVVDE